MCSLIWHHLHTVCFNQRTTNSSPGSRLVSTDQTPCQDIGLLLGTPLCNLWMAAAAEPKGIKMPHSHWRGVGSLIPFGSFEASPPHRVSSIITLIIQIEKWGLSDLPKGIGRKSHGISGKTGRRTLSPDSSPILQSFSRWHVLTPVPCCQELICTWPK